MYRKYMKWDKILNEKAEEFGWWIEICTAKPICIYYFGVFDSRGEAELAKNGYIEDIDKEGSELISIHIKRCQPKQLTIFGNELKSSDLKIIPTAVGFN
ncbi:MAG: DUF1816 domain-containing protein [Xenococcaceae cyanobacterium]